MKKEILSSCCAYGGNAIEVYVLESECPINRELGKRVQPNFNKDVVVKECNCIYISDFKGEVVPPCKYYNGLKQVKRKKKTEYKVECAALK